jgi:WD40 repeat protein
MVKLYLDQMIRQSGYIWNTTAGEIEVELKGHTDGVTLTSLVFSQDDGSQFVSGSRDKTVQIWNVMTDEIKAELKGHTSWMTCIALAQDGSQNVSGSHDGQSGFGVQ